MSVEKKTELYEAKTADMMADLPEYTADERNKELGREATPKKPKLNILQDQLLELMHERKISLSVIQKETEIPWGTLMEWHNGTVNVQKVDKNLLALARFFNVTIDYLCFGIGEDTPYYDKDKTASA